MDKFSDYIKKTNTVETNGTGEILFQDGNYKVKRAEGWIYMDEPDMIIAIIYLSDTGEVMFRYEYVPTYKCRDSKEHYLTMLSGTMNKNEKPIQCLFREVLEETGMSLKPSVEAVEVNTLFVSKGCSAKYHIYFLEINSNDYDQVEAKGDGSDAEANSQSIRIPVSQIPHLEIEDTITGYCVEYLKNYFKMNEIY
jgi:8-oxo-dGTP pyrophosphatase MutT (NUDIX family)